MELFWPLASNVLIPGALFSLITAGFSLTYSVSRVQHLAHGGIMIFAGYIFYAMVQLGQFPVWSGYVAAIVSAIVLGVGINSFIYERVRKNGIVTIAGSLLVTLSVLYILQNIILVLFGSNVKTFVNLQGTVHAFGNVFVSDNQIRIVVFSTICLIGLILFLAKTKYGKAIRAMADNEVAAEIVGVSGKKIRTLAFVIGSGLAGLAGVLFAIEYGLEPSMSVMATIRMFFRGILGGIGSIGGSILGSLITETVVALTGWYWKIGWSDFTTFLIVFVVLLFRPEGLLGKRKRLI